MQKFPQDECLTLRNINQGFIIAHFLSKNLHNQGHTKKRPWLNYPDWLYQACKFTKQLCNPQLSFGSASLISVPNIFQIF